MFSKTPHIIEDLQGFVKVVSDLTNNPSACNYVFRGQLYHKKYKLIPSLQRSDESHNQLYKKEAEKMFFEKFKTKVIPYLTKMPNNYWEWLFLMQHYRTPTRLLDWSQSPLIALFFALDTDNYTEVDDDSPVVWCLNTYALNDKFKMIQNSIDVPNICDSDEVIQTNLEHSFKYMAQGEIEYPIAISGPLNSIRISAQKGLFTLFPYSNNDSLENKTEADDFLEKIIIKNECIKDIKKELFNLGITYSSVYPEIDSVAKDIINEYQMQYGEI